MKKEHFNSGKNNGMWKGNNAGYGAIHAWVRKRKKKPLLCERCKKRKSIDLSNISGKYLRNINDFEYLCRKCHQDLDGRNEQLRQNGKSRKLPYQKCLTCGKMFHRDKLGKYCSKECYNIGRVKNRKCKICSKKHYAKGFCQYHWQKKRNENILNH